MKTNKIKNVLKEISFWTMAILIPAGLLAQVCWATANLVAYPVDYEVVESITVPRADKEEINIREYVLNEVEKAGLSRREAECIITNESQWREDICIIEPNNSISCGLWMLNTVHNKGGLTNACKTDFRCATKWAIEKRLRDGNWNAWTQWKVCK